LYGGAFGAASRSGLGTTCFVATAHGIQREERVKRRREIMTDMAKYVGIGLACALMGAGLTFLFSRSRQEKAGDMPGSPPVRVAASESPAEREEPTGKGKKKSPSKSSPAEVKDPPSPPLADRTARLEKENLELQARLRELQAKVDELTAPPVRAPEVFRFGLGEKTPAFDKADWKDLSTHMSELAKAMPKLADEITKTHNVSDSTRRLLQKHNLPLAKFAIEAAGEIEGTGPNGSYTHPAVIANLIRAALEEAGSPLTESQEMSIRALGNTWVREVERSTQRYTETTPVLARTVDEVDAKLRFLYSVKEILTPAQRDILFHPVTEGRVGLDLLSPALVYMSRIPQGAKTRQELEARIIERIFKMSGIEGVDGVPFEWVARLWIDDLPTALQPVKPGSMDLIFPHVDTIQAAARAEVAAITRITGMGQLQPEQEKALRGMTTVIIPQLIGSQ
jgi:hypothetical protein